jgi:hypothetical protein
MNAKTKQRIQEIKNKAKSRITGSNEFSCDNAVIDYAIEQLSIDLKRRGLL